MSICWLEKDELLPAVLEKLKHSNIVLDIGCGIRPQNFIRPLVHICCEPYEQYIEYLQEKVKNEYDRNYVIVKASWANVVKIFPPRSVDAVFLVDVIEHLEKDEALRLLQETERIVRNQIAIFTPLGFFPQEHSNGKDAWGLDGGIWQEHKSGWYPEDFDDSWDVYVSKEFRAKDNLGRCLKDPGGAFWAIKLLDGVESENREVIFKKEKIQALVDMAIDVRPSILLNLFVRLMHLTLKLTSSNCGRVVLSSMQKVKYISGKH
jgi:hypothetical protein